MERHGVVSTLSHLTMNEPLVFLTSLSCSNCLQACCVSGIAASLKNQSQDWIPRIFFFFFQLNKKLSEVKHWDETKINLSLNHRTIPKPKHMTAP